MGGWKLSETELMRKHEQTHHAETKKLVQEYQKLAHEWEAAHDKLADELSAAREEIEYRRDNQHRAFCEWRGVELENHCPKCQGAGSRMYASTATWRGGMGGQAVTLDVCDGCWGSGDKTRTFANLRTLAGLKQRAEAAYEKLKRDWAEDDKDVAYWEDRAEASEAARADTLAENEKLNNALGQIHIICMDAGIDPGNVVDRVRTLSDQWTAMQDDCEVVKAENAALRKVVEEVKKLRYFGQLPLNGALVDALAALDAEKGE